jgi:UDP-glucose 4-epimerase
MNDRSPGSSLEFQRVNVEGSVHLARQAAAAGATRFIYLSSIKANGESTQLGKPFSVTDEPNPQDPYGQSKVEAEQQLAQVSKSTGMELVVIRPPLVYGPGVRANFLSMMTWLHRGIPLPLGAIHNRRSLVSVDNLCDLVKVCTAHPTAAGKTFLVSDGEDVSTTELLTRMAAALACRARLLPIPEKALRYLMSVLGKNGVARRLCDSLQVDISYTRQELAWTPPNSVDSGLAHVAKWYLRKIAGRSE